MRFPTPTLPAGRKMGLVPALPLVQTSCARCWGCYFKVSFSR